MTKRKKIASALIGVVAASALVAIPTIAIRNISNATISFDSHNIGIYVEKEWRPAYDLAVEKYNQQGGHKYTIEVKELGSFDVLNMIDTLGYIDEKVPDIIYMPLDKIPVLVQEKQALMGFGTPSELLEGISTDVTGNSEADRKAFADNGSAIVKGANGNNLKYYFAIPHAKEALIMYYKYDKATNASRVWNEDYLKTKTFKELYEEANADQWKTTMVAGQFQNLWQSLGVVAGFIDQQKPGSGTNGQDIGRALATFNTLDTRFQSSMTRINDPTNTSGMQEFDKIPGWTNGTLSTLEQSATGLKNATDFIATFYKSTLSKPNLALNKDGTRKNDWLLNGGIYGKTVNDLFKNPEVKNAVVIDGPWAKDNFKGLADGAIPVVPMTTGVNYLQAPGGWMYGINQRNYNKPDKVEDIKSFINILLSDKEVIKAEYDYAGKIVTGKVSEESLPNSLTDKYDSSVLDAVLTSKTMDGRPDGGNAEFGNCWGAWDGEGWSANALLSDLSNPSVSDADLKKVRTFLVNSFETMIRKMQQK